MKKSPVYFVPIQQADSLAAVRDRLKTLLDRSRILDDMAPADRCVIKIHFGEEGNTGFVCPDYVGSIVKRITARGATAVLSDSNTLYKGRRTTSADHAALAREHGFTKERCGAEVEIADESHPGSITRFAINRKHITNASIPSIYLTADVLIGVAHFKGHMMTGFGGALKNIGMGCATREGKLAQHGGVAPFINVQNCIGCGGCVVACPVAAITLHEKRAVLDSRRCIGCASCIAACQYHAVDIQWAAGSATIQERMVEYADAVLANRAKSLFFNVATKITAECDCLAQDDPRIVDDIGIAASTDPVALDQACFDLVCRKAGNRDIFQEVHPGRDGQKQLAFAEQIGLGTRSYDLITIG
jgi:uncharacterized Fe-S center protein